MSNPGGPKYRKKAILCAVWGVCRRQQGLYDWIACVHGGLLLAMTETHDQTHVRHDCGHDHLKAGFGFPDISALTNPQPHQAGNPVFNDNAFA